MLRAMVTFLLENGKIETTVKRAKEVSAMAEKMITLGKTNDLATKRQVLAYVTKEDVAKSFLTKFHQSTLTVTADIHESLKSVPAAATPQKWLSFSWYNIIKTASRYWLAVFYAENIPKI